jgi:PAS domain S-box-containing protein
MSSNVPTISRPPFPISTEKVKAALIGLLSLTAVLWLGSRFLLGTNFLPHWYCYLGNQRLLWSNVLADLVVGLSYVTISSTLVWLVCRAGPDLPYPYFFWAFGVFIVSCGVTHFMEVLTVWKPVYWLSTAAKIVTATASAGTAAVLLFAADDIVDFVRTAREAAARRGNEQFRTLVNASPMAVVSADLDGKVTVWNPAAERLFGWLAAEIVGNVAPFTPPDREAEGDELRKEIIGGEIVLAFETVRRNRAGEQIPVSISAAPVFDENGRLISTVRVFEDIRERKRIELELKEKTDLLSTVTQALNAYLEVGDWAAASRQLLSFAMQKTQSQCGFLGVILEGSVLRVLAHNGLVWDSQLNRERFAEKMRQFATCGYFEIEHKNNLLGEIIQRGQTIISNSATNDRRGGGVPPGHPAMHSLAGVPIFKRKETVGLIAVANRPGGYAGEQVRHLEAMSQATGVLYDNYRQGLKRAALEE